MYPNARLHVVWTSVCSLKPQQTETTSCMALAEEGTMRMSRDTAVQQLHGGPWGWSQQGQLPKPGQTGPRKLSHPCNEKFGIWLQVCSVPGHFNSIGPQRFTDFVQQDVFYLLPAKIMNLPKIYLYGPEHQVSKRNPYFSPRLGQHP